MLKDWKVEGPINQFSPYERFRIVQESPLQSGSENRNDLIPEGDNTNDPKVMFYLVSLDWRNWKEYVKTHTRADDKIGLADTLTIRYKPE